MSIFPRIRKLFRLLGVRPATARLELGGIDILVNNAARHASFEELDEKQDRLDELLRARERPS